MEAVANTDLWLWFVSIGWDGSVNLIFEHFLMQKRLRQRAYAIDIKTIAYEHLIERNTYNQ